MTAACIFLAFQSNIVNTFFYSETNVFFNLKACDYEIEVFSQVPRSLPEQRPVPVLSILSVL